MNALSQEQVIALHKSNTNALYSLTNQTFDGLQSVVEANLEAVRQALGESQAYWLDVLSIKTPEALMTRQVGRMQSGADMMLAYSRKLYEVMSGTQTEMMKILGSQYGYHDATTRTLVDHLAKQASVGAEVARAMLDPAFSNAGGVSDPVRKSGG
ncbi:Phasin family protein [Burkholderia multivorans]